MKPHVTPSATPAATRFPPIVYRQLGLLVLVLVPTFFTGLNTTMPWLKAEARILTVTENMAASGDLLVPDRGDGKPHLTKPPLVYWLSYAGSTLTGGVGLIAIRIPQALCGLATVLLVYLLGLRLWNSPACGLYSALVLGTTYLFVQRAHIATYDIPLTLCTTLALLGGWEWLAGRARGGLAVLLAGCVLGFMVKGPVAWLVIGLALLVTLAVRGELRRLLHRGFPAMLVLTVVCSLPWFIAILVTTPQAAAVFREELEIVFGRGNWTSSTTLHYYPFYQYAVWLVGRAMPWTLFAPLLVVAAWQRPDADRRAPLVFPLVWLLAGLLVLSLFPKKQSAYVLPLLPALALVLGRVLVLALERGGPLGSALRACNLLAGVVVLCASVPAGMVLDMRVNAPLWLAVAGGALLLAGGLAVLWCQWRRGTPAALTALLATLLVFSPLVYGYFLPRHRTIHKVQDSQLAEEYEETLEQLPDEMQDVINDL